VDNLPSIAELQLLVPQGASASRGPQPAPSRPSVRADDLAPAAVTPLRRRERATLWQDSSFFQDSFFAPDNRLDASLTGGELPQPEPVRTSRAATVPDVDLSEQEPMRDDEIDDLDAAGRRRYPGTGTHN
jgi:hypothetical protein